MCKASQSSVEVTRTMSVVDESDSLFTHEIQSTLDDSLVEFPVKGKSQKHNR